MSKFKVGDMVLMTRRPTDDDWHLIGEVDIPPEYYTTPQRVVDITSRSIVLADNEWSYPACCFELVPEAKAGDYIVILDGRGASHLKYKTFYVVSVTDGIHFELAEPGRGTESTIGWTCSDPACYKIKHSLHTQAKVGDWIEIVNTRGASWLTKGEAYPVLALDSHDGLRLDKTHGIWACTPDDYIIVVRPYGEPTYKPSSDIGMSNYEPSKQFKVGDNVKVIVDGMWFNAGQVAKILEVDGDIIQMYSTKRSKVLNIHKAYVEHTDDIPVITGEYPRYKVDLPTFDHGSLTQRLSEIQSDFFKQIKNQHNGTESNKQSVKLQRVNLEIREGNPIRGIGLKGSGSKIKLGSNYRYH